PQHQRPARPQRPDHVTGEHIKTHARQRQPPQPLRPEMRRRPPREHPAQPRMRHRRPLRHPPPPRRINHPPRAAPRPPGRPPRVIQPHHPRGQLPGQRLSHATGHPPVRQHHASAAIGGHERQPRRRVLDIQRQERRPRPPPPPHPPPPPPGPPR